MLFSDVEVDDFATTLERRNLDDSLSPMLGDAPHVIEGVGQGVAVSELNSLRGSLEGNKY